MKQLHCILLILLCITGTTSVIFKKTKREPRKLQDKDTDVPDLTHSIDVREMLNEKEKDNPLSELWDANNMRVTKQNVNLNMNVPLNRLKLLLSDKYRVKIIVHNDEDFDQLYDYFNPKDDNEKQEKNESDTKRRKDKKLKSKK